MIIFFYHPLYVKWNHGLSLLSSVLREKGIENKVIVLPCNIHEVVKKYNPTYIGFSYVTIHDYNLCQPFVESAKKYDIPILAGGVFSRLSSKVEADYVCKGEGEILSDFILDGDTKLFDLPYLHKNLDDLPLPDYSDVTGYEFQRGLDFLKGLKIIPYSGSRGCPYNCNFCNIKWQPKGVRFKTTYKKDLKYLYDKYSPDIFLITDELLPYYSDQWCDLFAGNIYPFIAYIRADIPEDRLMFLIKNGIRLVAFGIESGDEKYRNEILGKKLNDSDIWRTVSLLKKYSIKYVPFYMIGTEYENDIIKDRTVKMAEKVGGYFIMWKYEDLKEVI